MHKLRLVCFLVFGISLACAVALLFSGCALNQAKGPLFSGSASPQTGQALIYIYRPPTERHAYQRIYYVRANDIQLKNLKHGAYYPYEASPGHIKITAGGTKNFGIGGGGLEVAMEQSIVKEAKLEFDVEAGLVYYVKFHQESHAFYEQPLLFLMTNSDGENEIKDCKLATE